MSLVETGAGTGAVSLAGLLEGVPTESSDPGLTMADLVEEIARGGWPGLRGQPVSRALLRVRDYLDEIRRTDISVVDGVRRDPDRVGRLLQSLARNVATSVAVSTLAVDTGGSDGR